MRVRLVLAVFLLGALLATTQAADDPAPGKVPEGWKEFVSPTKVFSVWLPKGGLRSERNREVNFGKAKLKLSTLELENEDKSVYLAGQVALPVPAGAKVDPNSAIEFFRDGFLRDGGKVVDESAIKLGKMGGKEYQIQIDKEKQAILRLYCAGPRIYEIAVIGTKKQVESESAKRFFDSFKHQGMVKDDEIAAKGTPPPGKEPKIYGGGQDAQFKDLAPPGGFLVGLEIGVGNVFNTEMTRSVRPIYRVGDKESFGKQYGTNREKVTTFKAKQGYAIGAISAKFGLGFDGVSITFMKIVNDKLDTKDSYESDYIGTNENKRPTKIVSDGTPVIGVVGRTNDKDMTGMGLLFKGQEGFEPKKR